MIVSYCVALAYFKHWYTVRDLGWQGQKETLTLYSNLLNDENRDTGNEKMRFN